MSERYRATPADYKMIFDDHKVGALILEDLILRFAKSHVTRGGIDAVLQTYSNAGQRELLDFIAKQINRANDVPVNEEPDDVPTQ